MYKHPVIAAELFALLFALLLVGCGAQGTGSASSDSAAIDAAQGESDEAGDALAQTELENASPTAGMAWIPAGSFVMGTDDGHWNAAPPHTLAMDGFWMETHEVTNAQFAAFVEATGYVTVAEKPIGLEIFPEHMRDQVTPDMLLPGSQVFTPTPRAVALNNELQWWRFERGADWRHPEGPGTSIADRMDEPVVHVCLDDALAYAEWAGKSLPTEAQWEYAARGGLEDVTYVWGDVKVPDGQWMANIWQGEFPVHNTAEDGYEAAAPVGSFAPNGYGLYDMSGNVWELCLDLYSDDYYANSPAENPPGPEQYVDHGPRAAEGLPMYIIRGGSFLCSDVYCKGYQPTTRMYTSRDSAMNHTGFRCVNNTLTGPGEEN